MSQVGAPRGRTCSRTIRSVALLTSGVLALPVLAACSSDGDERSKAPAAAQDVGPAARDRIADGGTLRWAVDTVPTTLNTFQADADAATSRIAGAVLPSLFTLDKTGRPQRNPDYLESAKIIEREPKQVVLYKLNQQAVWSDGRELGAADFVAQWRALSGKDSAYWTARNAGYERIQKIERGANDLEVRVTFNKPYADWRALFSPLYPKDVMGAPNSFNDGARAKLKATAGPFQLKEMDRADREITLVRNPRWWGARPKLDTIVLSAVPRDKRAAALAAGTLDLAEIDSPVAERITQARHNKGGGAGPQTGAGPASGARGPGAETAAASATPSSAEEDGSGEEKAEAARESREKKTRALAKYAKEQRGLGGYVVRKSLEPAFTQLALNGETGPLADERVRRAVARALDRKKLAEAVLKPLGLPANPPGSHLALAGQHAYADSSDALGDQNTREAQALLADAGWTPGGAVKKDDGTKAGSEADADKKKDKEKGENGSETSGTDKKKEDKQEDKQEDKKEDKKEDKGDKEADRKDSESGSASDSESASDEGAYIVGDNKPGRGAPSPRPAAASSPRPRPARPGGWTTRTSTPRIGSRAAWPAPTLRAARRHRPPTPRPPPPPRRHRHRPPHPPPRPPHPCPARSARTASPSPSASSCPPGPAPSSCAPSARRSRACSTASASVRRSPRSPTPTTSRTTSRRATTTWPCTRGPRPPTPRPTAGRSTPSPSRPPTARCWWSRTTPASVRTTSTSSSTRRPPSWTRRRPAICSAGPTPVSGRRPGPSPLPAPAARGGQAGRGERRCLRLRRPALRGHRLQGPREERPGAPAEVGGRQGDHGSHAKPRGEPEGKPGGKSEGKRGRKRGRHRERQRERKRRGKRRAVEAQR